MINFLIVNQLLTSGDGKKVHKVDLKLKRSVLSHDIGVTQK